MGIKNEKLFLLARAVRSYLMIKASSSNFRVFSRVSRAALRGLGMDVDDFAGFAFDVHGHGAAADVAVVDGIVAALGSINGHGPGFAAVGAGDGGFDKHRRCEGVKV